MRRRIPEARPAIFRAAPGRFPCAIHGVEGFQWLVSGQGRLMRGLRRGLKYLMAAFYVLAGVNHFLNPAVYLKIMPPYLPWHRLLVEVSGVCEIALGLLLLVPRCMRWAAWGLIALLI